MRECGREKDTRMKLLNIEEELQSDKKDRKLNRYTESVEMIKQKCFSSADK